MRNQHFFKFHDKSLECSPMDLGTPSEKNAGLLPFVEKRKGSFFSGRKQKMEKGKGGLGSDWFHIPPWEVPNFRASFEVGMKRALRG